MSTHLDRRTLLRLGLAVPAAGVLGACASPAKNGSPAAAPSGGVSVDPKAPLEFFNFDGGFGKEWTTLPLDLYRKAYPDAEVKLTSGQQLLQQLQPRFVQGNPPDLIENVGLDTAALINQKQLVEFSALLSAPAFDTEGKTVAETMLPGAAEAGKFDGEKYAQPLGYGLGGVWYSKKLMDAHGWQYPTTWDEMMTLCAEIKNAGIAPWTYQGKFPGYMTGPLIWTAGKSAGLELSQACDNLEPNAWRHEALVQAAERIREIAAKGFLLEGSTGLSHTQSQTYWAQGKAVFIPCGSWLENEVGDAAPKDFGMTVAPAPRLSASDKMPFETVNGGPGGEMIVPAKAKNSAGGIELLRIMLSKQVARNSTTLNKSMSVIAGAADGLELSSALTSMHAVIKAAGDNVYPDWKYNVWYKKMVKTIDDGVGALMNLEITADEWSKRVQKAADEVVKDKNIKKYKR
jgi:N-acetylglucosamine transport system substrate-binding protein